MLKNIHYYYYYYYNTSVDLTTCQNCTCMTYNPTHNANFRTLITLLSKACDLRTQTMNDKTVTDLQSESSDGCFRHGLICRAHAMAFHFSASHVRTSETKQKRLMEGAQRCSRSKLDSQERLSVYLPSWSSDVLNTFS